MVRDRLIIRTLAFLLIVLPLPGWSDVLSSFTAIYQVERDGLQLGRARFTLTPQGENCYLYQGIARPEGLAALLVGETLEQSHFCVAGGKIRPVSYRSQEDGKKGERYTLNFDWPNRLVRLDNGTPRKLAADGVDPLSLQIALRKLMSDANGNLNGQSIKLRVVEDDREKDYHFRVVGIEKLTTPIGKLDVVRIDRSDDSKRQLRLWLAPGLDYLPIRVEQQKRQGAVTRLNIETLPDSPAD